MVKYRGAQGPCQGCVTVLPRRGTHGVADQIDDAVYAHLPHGLQGGQPLRFQAADDRGAQARCAKQRQPLGIAEPSRRPDPRAARARWFATWLVESNDCMRMHYGSLDKTLQDDKSVVRMTISAKGLTYPGKTRADSPVSRK